MNLVYSRLKILKNIIGKLVKSSCPCNYFSMRINSWSKQSSYKSKWIRSQNCDSLWQQSMQFPHHLIPFYWQVLPSCVWLLHSAGPQLEAHGCDGKIRKLFSYTQSVGRDGVEVLLASVHHPRQWLQALLAIVNTYLFFFFILLCIAFQPLRGPRNYATLFWAN